MSDAGLTIPGMAVYREQVGHWRIHRGGRPAAPAAQPLVSVVTVTYNAAAALPRAITSVAAQTYPALEYIIADGGSHDATLDRIREHEADISLWLSEKDAGISDAFNRGVALASGTYVAIINADDWLSSTQLAFAVETLEQTGADFVFGDLRLQDEAGGVIIYAGDPNYARLIHRRMPALNHPTMVVRRDAYERYGLFVLELRTAMDYELLLRLHRAGARGVYDPRIVGNMSLGGASDRNFRQGLAECRRVSIFYGYPPALAWCEYVFSAAKGRGRRLLQAVLPKSLLHALWRWVNPRFRSALPGSPTPPPPPRS